jgi:hypothetical protein
MAIKGAFVALDPGMTFDFETVMLVEFLSPF